MIRIFQILAVTLLAVAAFFLYRGTTDAAFVTGVLAACAFFLYVRSTVKPRVHERNAQRIAEVAEQSNQSPETPKDPTE